MTPLPLPQSKLERHLKLMMAGFSGAILCNVNRLGGKGELNSLLIETTEDLKVNPFAEIHEVPIGCGVIPIHAFEIEGGGGKVAEVHSR